MSDAEIDLNYDLKSFFPAVSLEEIHQFERKLSDYFEQSIQLPDEFIQQLLHFHGGIPGKQCFRSPTGEIRIICRFCNIFRALGDQRLSMPAIPSWRPGGASDVRLDYSINYLFARFDYSGRLDESGGNLVPIAAIDTAGHNAREMSEMNLLCLDFRKPEKPIVVTWDFELSWCNPRDTIKVADSFGQFLTMLYERPDDFAISNDCEFL
ncbi:MAG: SMI1/KNR4 family protein [Planctomycetaceae bacterium]|nr:SMI1/KNR4 family protein [Planctomycetaceae bacterium]